MGVMVLLCNYQISEDSATKSLFIKWKDKLIGFCKWVWEECKDWHTLALLFAVVVIMYTPVWGGYLLHIIFKIKWGSVVATAYMAFWAGPFTPFFPLCIAITFSIKKLYEKITGKKLGKIREDKLMNEVISAMKSRRSIRKFKDEMPQKHDIEQIIEAGLFAANGRGEQNVITVAVTNREIRNELSKTNAKIGGWKEDFDPFYGAPVILIVLSKKDWSNRVYDGSLVMGNMMLAAHSLGLGSIWIHRAKEEFEMPQWQDFLAQLGVKGEWEGIGHCAVGFIDGEAPKAAARKSERVFWAE